MRPKREGVQDRLDPDTDRVVALPNATPPKRADVITAARCSAAARCSCSWAALDIGGWRHYQAELAVAATAEAAAGPLFPRFASRRSALATANDRQPARHDVGV